LHTARKRDFPHDNISKVLVKIACRYVPGLVSMYSWVLYYGGCTVAAKRRIKMHILLIKGINALFENQNLKRALKAGISEEKILILYAIFEI